MIEMGCAISFDMDNRLKEIRVSKGLTREAIASAVDTTIGQIYKLETGKARLSDVWLGKIAPVLGVPQGALLADGHCFDAIEADLRRVPVFDHLEARRYAFAAEPLAFAETAETHIFLRHPHDKIVGVAVNGTSIQRQIPQGAIAIIDFSDINLIEGRMYFAAIGENTFFGQYKGNPPRLEPQSISGEHETVFINQEVSIVGHVIQYQGIPE